ncbi:DUF192 domain-containing protein [Castellaniella sp.]|uniref:DUF192 domain-containing protein n=1 Tax=Castellaniella sp. TaxID=1955812 RepID=UPI00356A9D3F
MTLVAARGFKARWLGLAAWSTWGNSPRGLLFMSCNAIHTWALANPIDVLFLGPAGAVLSQHESLRPWRWAGCVRASAVLELPAGYCRMPGWQAQLAEAWSRIDAP